MKTRIYILLAFLTFQGSYAQTEEFICGIQNDNTPDELGVYSYNADLNSLNNYGPVVHNIFIWGINKDDGTSDDIVTQVDALELVATLNIE